MSTFLLTQKAIRAAILADSALNSLVKNVVDTPKEELPFPYITIGSGTSVPNDTLQGEGEIHAFVLHVWNRGDGTVATRTIQDHLKRLFHRQDLTVGDNRAVGYHQITETLVEPDDIIHGVCRFTFTVHAQI